MKKLIIALCLFAAPAGASCFTTYSAGGSYTTCSDGSSALTTGSPRNGRSYTTTTPGYGNQNPPQYNYGAPPPAADDGY